MKLIAVKMVDEPCYQGKVTVSSDSDDIVVDFFGKKEGELIKGSKFIEDLDPCIRKIAEKIIKERQ